MSPSSRESNGIEVQAEGAGPQLFSAEDYRAWIEAEMRTAVKAVLEEILEAELSAHLGAARSERTASRRGYRNGSYGRRLRTRVGEIEPAGAARAGGDVPARGVRALPEDGVAAGGGALAGVRGRGEHAQVYRTSLMPWPARA